MKKLVQRALFGFGLAAALQVHAATHSESLSFSAPLQSLWGSGGSADFGASGSTALGPLSFSYDIGASSGSVSGRFNGSMSVDYAPVMGAPGTTSLGLSFLGDPSGGQLKSDLGARVKVEASAFGLSVDVLNKNYALNVDQAYTPALGHPVSGDAAFTAGSIGIDIGVVQAGANFDIQQTDTFKATAIDGMLAYTARGSGQTGFMPFSMTSDGGLNLDVGLTQPGIWDFKLVDMNLANTFSTSFDAAIILKERNRGCGFLGLEWCAWNSLPIADIDVYGGSPFALDFDSVSGGAGFSVQVVPEPGTLPLLVAGALFIWGVAGTRRESARAHGR